MFFFFNGHEVNYKNMRYLEPICLGIASVVQQTSTVKNEKNVSSSSSTQWVYARHLSERPQTQVQILIEVKLSCATISTLKQGALDGNCLR